MNKYAPPIPVRLLIHSCTLNRYEKSGVFGEKALKKSWELSKVRFSCVRKKITEKGFTRFEECCRVYYDCCVSLPAGIELDDKDSEYEIVFCGRSYAVTEVKKIFSDTGVHHLEIELEGG